MEPGVKQLAYAIHGEGWGPYQGDRALFDRS